MSVCARDFDDDDTATEEQCQQPDMWYLVLVSITRVQLSGHDPRIAYTARYRVGSN